MPSLGLLAEDAVRIHVARLCGERGRLSTNDIEPLGALHVKDGLEQIGSGLRVTDDAGIVTHRILHQDSEDLPGVLIFPLLARQPQLARGLQPVDEIHGEMFLSHNLVFRHLCVHLGLDIRPRSDSVDGVEHYEHAYQLVHLRHVAQETLFRIRTRPPLPAHLEHSQQQRQALAEKSDECVRLESMEDATADMIYHVALLPQHIRIQTPLLLRRAHDAQCSFQGLLFSHLQNILVQRVADAVLEIVLGASEEVFAHERKHGARPAFAHEPQQGRKHRNIKALLAPRHLLKSDVRKALA